MTRKYKGNPEYRPEELEKYYKGFLYRLNTSHGGKVWGPHVRDRWQVIVGGRVVATFTKEDQRYEVIGDLIRQGVRPSEKGTEFVRTCAMPSGEPLKRNYQAEYSLFTTKIKRDNLLNHRSTEMPSFEDWMKEQREQSERDSPLLPVTVSSSSSVTEGDEDSERLREQNRRMTNNDFDPSKFRA